MLYDLKQRPATILIVDDQPSNIRLIRDTVRGLGNVLFATSGATAIEMIRRSPPDILLLDIEMPGMDGFAVCQAIKSDPATSDVAIIFITAHDEDAHEIAALGMGGVDFLNKPLNIPIARVRIQTHLTLRIRSRQLVEARRDLEDVIQNLPAFISHWDASFRNIFTNDLEGQWFGVRASQMVGKHIADVLGEVNFSTIRQSLEGVYQGNRASLDISFISPDGHSLHGQASLVCRNREKRAAEFLLLITDVTERKNAEMALYDEKERIRITLNSIGDAVIATDVMGAITFLNPIAEDMTGWHASEAIGLPIEQVMPLKEGDDGHTLQNPVRLALRERRTVGMALNCMLIRRDGRAYEVEDSAAPIYNHADELTGAIIVFHDVSETRAMAVKMTHLANHDALTNLPNRMLLRDRTEQAIRNAKGSDGRVALLLLDLDHFKSINDSSGHLIGDQLLQQISRRLGQNIRDNNTVSRQGGDEFIILLQNLHSIEDIAAIAENLIEIVSEPYFIEESRFDLSASVGVSLFPDDSKDLESLYHHADAAMYRAKKDGRNRVQFFCNEIEDSLQTRHKLEKQIAAGLENHEFEVFYQPKVDAKHLTIVGAEALVRWRRTDGQLISPTEFIPLAEETGLIVPLGLQVLRQAGKSGANWLAAGHKIRIAVNVSIVQLVELNFVETVKCVIEETGIAPGLLELEITESVLASNMLRTLETLVKLKEMGVSIALDDFGTGYSSLAYLKRFPIDVLKIDQSFVRDMLTDKSDAGIVEAVIQMARSLELRLVAEGVEQEDQAQALLALGCQIMQGYLFSRPIPLAEFEALLSRGLS